jgi:hypothetical protein
VLISQGGNHVKACFRYWTNRVKIPEASNENVSSTVNGLKDKGSVIRKARDLRMMETFDIKIEVRLKQTAQDLITNI